MESTVKALDEAAVESRVRGLEAAG
jgi:hypothetical protein